MMTMMVMVGVDDDDGLIDDNDKLVGRWASWLTDDTCQPVNGEFIRSQHELVVLFNMMNTCIHYMMH